MKRVFRMRRTNETVDEIKSNTTKKIQIFSRIKLCKLQAGCYIGINYFFIERHFYGVQIHIQFIR